MSYIINAMISVLRRARILVAGSLITALTVIAAQAPLVAHAVGHWAASAHEHSHDEAIHRHDHDAQHDHELHVQKCSLSVVPDKFVNEFDRNLLPICVLTSLAAAFPMNIVSADEWNVRGPPLPLPHSFPPAYNTAPPAV
ncbi:MAG: hypothetical protein NUW21_06380 [Elusimicrobia bacterium]|nr:hypothetical protein [Elusimicrobiota bacterium]